MKRLFLGLLALFLVVGAAALSGDKAPLSVLQITQQERNPWSHLRLNNDADDFRFAIVSDRTGGHREKVESAPEDRSARMKIEVARAPLLDRIERKGLIGMISG